MPKCIREEYTGNTSKHFSTQIGYSNYPRLFNLAARLQALFQVPSTRRVKRRVCVGELGVGWVSFSPLHHFEWSADLAWACTVRIAIMSLGWPVILAEQQRVWLNTHHSGGKCVDTRCCLSSKSSAIIATMEVCMNTRGSAKDVKKHPHERVHVCKRLRQTWINNTGVAILLVFVLSPTLQACQQRQGRRKRLWPRRED